VAALNKVGELTKRYNKFVDKGGAVVVKSQAEANNAGVLVSDLAAASAWIDSLWRREADLAHQLHKSLTDKIRKYRTPTDQKITLLKTAVRNWLVKEEEARREKAAAAQAKLDEEIPMAGIAVMAEKAQVEGLKQVKVWTYRITDEAKIPREFLRPDDEKIAAHVKQHRGATAIPGIEAYEDTRVSR
jgi:hypothetical protein